MELQEESGEAVKDVKLEGVQNHAVIAGNVETGGISPTTAIKLRETSHGCC